MDWLFLVVAGFCEIGWPLGLKISQASANRMPGIALAVMAMAASGVFLWLAQKTIPMGTAYAVWTGIGAAGTFIIGVIVFRDSADLWRILSVLLIIAGVIGLKLSHQ
ncbi:MAG: multidrug efflux SMR transporter [Spirochaetes bacterium]|jgi:quaternary ammonium compound-resistance protein SugE|nr:multidrug efflux SMR transporter [Spirochaetota bacterium]